MNEKKLPVLEEMPNYCPPDEQDLFIASHVVGKPCPFCGNISNIALPRHNKETGIYSYTINCTNDLRCGASVFTNGRNRAEVRGEAMKRWNTRANETK